MSLLAPDVAALRFDLAPAASLAPVPPSATATPTTLLTLKPVGRFTVPVPSPVRLRLVFEVAAVTMSALIVDILFS
jgi:hypothetical protein